MADAELEKTTVNIDILPATDEAQDCVEGHHFVAQGEVTIFDGFMKVYRESSDDESADHTTNILPPVKDGDELQRREITSTERFSLAPARYTEASLVRKMEELGIEPEKNQPVFICHANCPDYVAYVKELLKERFNVTDVRADFIGPVIGAHAGPGTVALFFLADQRD